jgi:hypothetical protein
MPAAVTELFSDLNRENQVVSQSDKGQASTSSTFTVDCITGSSGATAFLQAQWSIDDVTWNDLANTPGQGNVLIDNAVDCPASGTIISASNILVSTSFPVAGSKVFFRVVGGNGGGVADVPAFAWISLTIRGANNPVSVPCVIDVTAKSAFSVTVRLRCFATITVTVTYGWTAQE